MTMKTIPEGLRPYERLEKYGVESLSDAELLAIVLKCGTREISALEIAQELIKNYGSLADIGRAELNELRQKKGIGRVKSIEIFAAIELGKRILLGKRCKTFSIKNAQEIELWLTLEMKALRQEVLKVLLFDRRWNYISSVNVSKGTADAAPANPREIFYHAIKNMASAIILAHNHPSGDCVPSKTDFNLTKRIIIAGRVVGIDVVDHIVIGDGECYSMREHGDMFALKEKALDEGEFYGT